MTTTHCPIVVLISGNGSNLQALIDASVHSNFKIAGVISNQPDALGLERAQRDDIPTRVVDHSGYADRKEFDLALLEAIEEFDPKLVVLAGFMRILGPEFVSHYAGRLINIHPSLLPRYPGIKTHQRAIDAGDKEHGCTVHFVTDETDGGPVIAQERVPITSADTPASLAARVLEKEHLVYAKVVSWFAAGRLRMVGNHALLDDEILPAHGVEIRP
ncbi:MAG: phosphoribosylglycinamide formyltransferase [Pseudohongiellaceae bacterium]